MTDDLGRLLETLPDDPETRLMLFSHIIAEADRDEQVAGVVGAFRGHGVDILDTVRAHPDLAGEILGDDVRRALED